MWETNLIKHPTCPINTVSHLNEESQPILQQDNVLEKNLFKHFGMTDTLLLHFYTIRVVSKNKESNVII